MAKCFPKIAETKIPISQNILKFNCFIFGRTTIHGQIENLTFFPLVLHSFILSAIICRFSRHLISDWEFREYIFQEREAEFNSNFMVASYSSSRK